MHYSVSTLEIFVQLGSGWMTDAWSIVRMLSCGPPHLC